MRLISTLVLVLLCGCHEDNATAGAKTSSSSERTSPSAPPTPPSSASALAPRAASSAALKSSMGSAADSPPGAPARCAGGTLPNREGFFREVLFAAPTSRTRRFHDLARGSYHVDKLDVARGLPEQATFCGVRLHALIVVGPMGPLWAYDVIAFIEEGDSIRANGLVMPHARITRKLTALVAVDDASRVLDLVRGSSLVRLCDATVPKSNSSYGLLLALYDNKQPRYFCADSDRLGGSPASEELLDAVNGLLERTTQTYPQEESAPVPPTQKDSAPGSRK